MTDNPTFTDQTARIVSQPSAVIPGIPAFIFSIPRGWVVDEAPNALAVIRPPQEVNGFWANAIISHDRVARAVDFKAAARVTWNRLLKSAPDAVLNGERLAKFGANVAYVRGVDFSTAEGRMLMQVHGLFFAPVSGGGKTVDFFQIIGTAPREVAPQAAEDFLEIIASFRFV